MVRAILHGTKTVTRRVGPTWARVEPGTKLWVREAHCSGDMGPVRPGAVIYRADYAEPPVGPWKPSIHMPRFACRLELEVVSVTEEYGLPGTTLFQHPVDATGDRLDCAVDDAEARREGFADRAAFLAAWRSMHPDHIGPVYRVEFRRITA